MFQLNRLVKVLYLTIIITLISNKYVKCIRYREKLKESGLGNFLLGLAGSAVSQGVQSATGSPLVSNPAMNNYGTLGATPTLGTPGSVSTPISGAVTGAATGAATGATAGIPAAATGAGISNPNSALTGAPPGAVTNAATASALNAAATVPGMSAMPSSTPSALSFTTIAFGSIVIMMICMVMLVCRRCTKDDD